MKQNFYIQFTFLQVAIPTDYLDVQIMKIMVPTFFLIRLNTERYHSNMYEVVRTLQAFFILFFD